MFVVGVLVGAVLGLVNGAAGRLPGCPALVITLGTLYVYRGIVLDWAGSDRINAADIPAGFRELGTQQILGIPVLTIIALVVLVAVGYYLRTARGGRELYAIGSDPDAAKLSACPSRAASSSPSSSAAPSPAWPASSTPPATARVSRRRLRHRAPGRRRGRHRRRGHLRRQRHGLGRGHRRLPAHHHQPGAAGPRHLGLLAAAPSSAR